MNTYNIRYEYFGVYYHCTVEAKTEQQALQKFDKIMNNRNGLKTIIRITLA